VLNEVLRRGKRLTYEAENYLREKISVMEIDAFLNSITNYPEIFITKEYVMKFIKSVDKVVREKEEEFDYDIKVITDSYKDLKEGVEINTLHEYYLRRYEVFSSELIADYGIRQVTQISRVSFQEGENYILGLVYSKKISKELSYLEIEDPTGKRRFYISRGDAYLNKVVQILPLDTVIAAKITSRRNKPPIINEIYLPKVDPNQNFPSQEIYAILTSDLHVGSCNFLYEYYDKFIEILNGRTENEKLREIIRKTYYLIIAGDLIDGVGIYPRQKEELLITDPYDQYKEAYNLLRKIPNKIKIIIIPGNHDITKKSLPRPPIDREYAKPLYDDPRILMLGDPVNIYLHGVNMFIFHGDFLNDIFSTTPGLSLENVTEAMDIILLTRHIAPTYGLQTKITPYSEDLLIVPKQVNVLHCGHIHRFGVKYRFNGRVLLVNSGTWQAQTKYQEEMGMKPTPGLIPFINLRTLDVYLVDLNK